MIKAKMLTAVFFVFLSTSIVCAQTYYEVIPIESPRGFTVRSMNAHGQVTGDMEVPGIVYNSDAHAAIWDIDTGLTDLGAFPDYNYSQGYGINDLGQVAGSCRSVGTVWSGSNNYTTIGNTTWPEDINNKGQITGWSRLTSPFNAFIWEESRGLLLLGSLGGSSADSHGRAINELGQIVGTSDLSSLMGGRDIRAFYWQDSNNNWQSDPGEMIDLGSFDGHDVSSAEDINDKGLIIGNSSIYGTPTSSRAFWTTADAGELYDIGDLGGDRSLAIAVNNLGQIVGWSKTDQGDRHAFIYQTSTDSMVDLNDLLVTENWELSMALDINDNGQILGLGYYNGNYSPVLLNPVPEPATLLLLSLGGVILRKRRTL